MKEPTKPVSVGPTDTLAVTLRLPNGGVVQGELREVSVNGLHLAFDEPPQSKGPCHVGMLLQTEKGALEVHAAGSIIRAHEDGVVVHVEKVVGVESMEHLRGLVLRDPAKARLKPTR